MAATIEWDRAKAATNWSKHGVTFEEAASVFENQMARIFPDPEHSDFEIREIIVGHSVAGRLLFVSFTERPRAGLIVISARKATRNEQKDYEESIAH